MPGGRNKSIGPVQVSMCACPSMVPFSFWSPGLGWAGSDQGSSSVWAGDGLAEPPSSLAVPAAGSGSVRSTPWAVDW